MILDDIAAKTRERITELMNEIPLGEVRAKAESMNRSTGFPFLKALGGEDISFICEVKKASPSKGVIAEDFPICGLPRSMRRPGRRRSPVLPSRFGFGVRSISEGDR